MTFSTTMPDGTPRPRTLLQQISSGLRTGLGLWTFLGGLFALSVYFIEEDKVIALLIAIVGIQLQVLEAMDNNKRTLSSMARDDTTRDRHLMTEIRAQSERLTEFGRVWNGLEAGPLKHDQFYKLCDSAAQVELSKTPAWVREWSDDRVKELVDTFDELMNSRVVLTDMGDIDRYLIDFLVPDTKDGGSIDATSIQSLDTTFWASATGRIYVEQLAAAVRRGVRVRRVFIYDHWAHEIASVAHEQKNLGMNVRRVRREDLKDARLRRDFIVFRDTYADGVSGRTTGYENAAGAVYELRILQGGDIDGCTITCCAPAHWNADAVEACESFDEIWRHAEELTSTAEAI